MKTIVWALFIAFITTSASANHIKIVYPIISESSGQSNYFVDLLKAAAENSNIKLEIVLKEYPHLRIKEFLKIGSVTLFQMQKTKERDLSYIPIDVGLTNKLIGKRVLFIRKNDQKKFDKINKISDIEQSDLVAGFGEDWLDVLVWKKNRLKVYEKQGEWSSLHRMLEAGRGIDYFPRSIIEIVRESRENPNLIIEKNLLLEFESDFVFYLSKKSKLKNKDVKLLKRMLEQAKKDGIINQVIKRHWANDIKKLGIDKRKKLKLSLP